MRYRFKVLVFALVVLFLFFVSSYFVNTYIDTLVPFVGVGVNGVLIYFFLIGVETILAPISVVPLIPIASAVWGWPVAGVITLLGWTTWAAVAFLLAQRFGTLFLERRGILHELHSLSSLLPEHHLLLGIFLLRLTVPIDLISYALGYFSSVRFRTFILGTLLGYAPLAFLLAYLGTIPFIYQLITFFIGGIIVLSGIIVYILYSRKYHRSRL
ncbi:MAG TPA: VTT domain-containing protein [Candidatus Nanoarchaeia archaeon]|nr:VTT domain-containing protein [Candidatus Nanoarchaeia archaeon]